MPGKRSKKGRSRSEAIRRGLKERDERQEFVRSKWRAGVHRGEIKRQFAREFDCDDRAAEPYLQAAREELLEDLGRPSEEHQAEALSVYRRIVRNCIVLEPRAAVAAQKRIDKILGNEAATRMRVEFTGEFRTVVDLFQDEDVKELLREDQERARKSTQRRRQAKRRKSARRS